MTLEMTMYNLNPIPVIFVIQVIYQQSIDVGNQIELIPIKLQQ